MRLGRKVNGVVTRRYLWDGQLRIVAELDGSGNLVSQFVYGTRVNVPEYMIKGGVTYRLIADQLGSVRLVVKASDGTVAQRIDYDEFGIATITPTGAEYFQPFGFAGGLYDNDTRLVRFGARDYDAETGRWTSKDPIGYSARSTNLYGYNNLDSVNGIDPEGMGRLCAGSMFNAFADILGIRHWWLETDQYPDGRGVIPDPNDEDTAIWDSAEGNGYSPEKCYDLGTSPEQDMCINSTVDDRTKDSSSYGRAVAGQYRLFSNNCKTYALLAIAKCAPEAAARLLNDNMSDIIFH